LVAIFSQLFKFRQDTTNQSTGTLSQEDKEPADT